MITLKGTGEKGRVLASDLMEGLPEVEIVVETPEAMLYVTRKGWDDDGNLYLVCEEALPPL